ncbi:NUDIX domain-containing protein [Sutcliffiella horikoshii]|uniref:NUDIX domain-containing protein n=1 Tax=Sutcliffiella horikoshii TaxID=79883 RepID=A0A5D4TJY7_9BACI|nr:NUDIX domain-containing protein [Sutcliffiella horikoshii]TYS74464.1 NUDIX domain-containing protein [Sutcliffiella horikoshii]
MSFHIRVRAGALIIQNASILLIEFNDENGLHYNLPAGGTEPGETLKEAVKREAKEEASIDVEVGSLAFVYEYAPHLNNNKYGGTHSLGLMFECNVPESCIPRLPANPDPNQTGVKWIPLTELDKVILYPNIKEHILAYAEKKRSVEIIEEHHLEEYLIER